MARSLNTGTRGGNVHREGVKLLRIQDVTEKPSQNSGNQVLHVQLVVLKNGRPVGNMIMDYVTLMEDAEDGYGWRWDQLMDALEAPEGIDIDPETWLVGKEVYGRVVIEEYNDEDRNKVKNYMTPAKAMKLLDEEAEKNGGQANLSPNGDSASKAKQRGRPARNSQISELSEEEVMPL